MSSIVNKLSSKRFSALANKGRRTYTSNSRPIFDMELGMNGAFENKVYERAFNVAKLERHMVKLLAKRYSAEPRPWRELYKTKLTKAGSAVLQEAEECLTDTRKVSASLVKINEETEAIMNSGIKLGHCAHRSALGIALLEFESGQGLPLCANLRHTLSADEFFEVLENGAPIIDEGVSVFHGSQTHRIQYRILIDHLGVKKAREVKQVISAEWQARPHPLSGRMGGDDVVTLWDEVFDVPTPWYCNNPDSLDVSNVLNSHQEKVDVHGFIPCMDARSPEWLQHLFFTAPDDVGITALKRCTGEELQTGRLKEVHQHIFLTGNEVEHTQSYVNLGFVVHEQPQPKRQYQQIS